VYLSNQRDAQRTVRVPLVRWNALQNRFKAQGALTPPAASPSPPAPVAKPPSSDRVAPTKLTSQ
jgi:hypothetical protein